MPYQNLDFSCTQDSIIHFIFSCFGKNKVNQSNELNSDTLDCLC